MRSPEHAKYRSYDGRVETQRLIPEIGRVYQGIIFEKSSKMSGRTVFIAKINLEGTETPKFILQLDDFKGIKAGKAYNARVVEYINSGTKKKGELPRFLCEVIPENNK